MQLFNVGVEGSNSCLPTQPTGTLWLCVAHVVFVCAPCVQSIRSTHCAHEHMWRPEEDVTVTPCPSPPYLLRLPETVAASQLPLCLLRFGLVDFYAPLFILILNSIHS